MIGTKKRFYKFTKYSADNAYGEMTLPSEPIGEVKMTIHTTAQSIQDNINYKGATYIGLTNSLLDDKTVIFLGELKLKVLYVNTEGRLNQVFMAEI
jgi:hypothetical protein